MSGGKTYQVTQVDPLNPHTKGMVYQVSVVGGFTQMKEMPEASADNVGIIYQYTGETDSNFTHGFFYESQALGTTPETYGWVVINVQPGGATNSATTDLSNLTAAGKNISNWSSNVSNCITEIPQDIKVELSNGTMILKAGSKVYKPNGSGVFDTYTLSADKTYTTSSNGTYALILTSSNAFDIVSINNTYSGSTAPTGINQYSLWYDTANNLVRKTNDSGTTWSSNPISFPICIFTSTNGAILSINQVFNGFGYIGSTIFALPGVSVLAPDGRNTNGTLKTYAYTVPSVIRRTDTTNGTYFLTINCNNGAFGVGQYVYDETTNYNYMNNAVSDKRCIVASATTTGGKVSDLTVKTPFHAVDYGDTVFIAHQAAPSDRYVNLSWPSSGGTITAPADGYFTLLRLSGATGEFAYFSNASSGLTMGVNAGDTGLNQRLAFPVSKGDIITIGYNLSGSATYLRFVYANGSK